MVPASGETPLHIAAAKGDVSVLAALLGVPNPLVALMSAAVAAAAATTSTASPGSKGSPTTSKPQRQNSSSPNKLAPQKGDCV